MTEDIKFEQRNKVLRDFVNQALKSKYWIYKPDGKLWYTPEEFLEIYSKRDIYTSYNFLESYKIMNPMKGVAAAKILIHQLTEKKEAFELKILEYFQNK